MVGNIMPDMYIKNGSVWAPAKKIYYRGTSSWSEVKEGWVKESSSWSNFYRNDVTVTLTPNTSVYRNIKSFFSDNEWNEDIDKFVIVPSGVETGGLWLYSADTSEWGGTLTIINNGTISGGGGAAGTGGAGGNAPDCLHFSVGDNSKLFLINNGLIRSGGGGGGHGGSGGTGYYNTTVYQPSSGYNYSAGSYHWLFSYNNYGNLAYVQLNWAGSTIYQGSYQGTPISSGSYVYERGGLVSTVEGNNRDGSYVARRYYGIRRYYIATTYTAGGAGGAGGTGQGVNQAHNLGLAGSAGGLYAGTGGAGGAGGLWGQPGAAGATGTSGNYSAGAAGYPGGAAGAAIRGTSRASITNNGTITGPTYS